MLRWMYDYTMRDKIRNDDIQGEVGVPSVEHKMREERLKWFRHMKRKSTDAPEVIIDKSLCTLLKR